jgi:hypothetical protein
MVRIADLTVDGVVPFMVGDTPYYRSDFEPDRSVRRLGNRGN